MQNILDFLLAIIYTSAMSSSTTLDSGIFDRPISAKQIAGTYNRYMNGYSTQFSPKTPLPKREEAALIQNFHIINQCIRSSGGNKVTILDFGCGDGSRFLKLFRDFGNIAHSEGNGVDVVAYDISSTALDIFANTLRNYGFREQFVSDRKNSFSRGNLKITLVAGRETDSLEFTRNLLKNGIKQHHIVMSMYGVMSHIPTTIGRQAVFSTLNEICSHHFICTVPGEGRFKKERRKFTELIQNGTPFRDATEAGDLYYAYGRNKRNTEQIFYHTYKIGELENDLKIAGFENISVGISSILTPVKLSWNPTLNTADATVSVIATKLRDKLPENVLNRASYFIATCSTPKLEQFLAQTRTCLAR